MAQIVVRAYIQIPTLREADPRIERQMSPQIQSRRCLFLLFVVAAALLPVALSRDQLSTRECEALGFTGLALCSDCNTFAEYVKDQELVSDCLKCCTEDSDDETSKITYSGAVLEVCMRKLVFYPEIVGFIEEEKDQFPSVKVQYVFNSPPKLTMLDEDGQQKDTIRIDNWKREHILQFLREKLKSASSK
ncbi:selenoprotein F isoform X2 [Punica granatum]|uniref:Selenoprotein F n=3 Tax=Punica granatum TaxID=22663 RepID=A0A6P8EKP9_PUNGR|nr:selenoprotein F isoform X2 [Punica granatum]